MDRNKERNFSPPVFLTFYSEHNTSISKQLGILGWKEEQKDLVHGSLIFIYVTKKGIECCFEIKNKLDSMDYIWKDEAENKQIIYKNISFSILF